jgi:hypothetical protein
VSERWTEIGGAIDWRTDDDFRVRPLVITTGPGGRIDAALDIGMAIRRAHAKTAVPPGHSCVSACAMIWLAGSKRFLDGRVGFHSASYLGTPYRAEDGNDAVADYYHELGMSDDFIRWATAADPNDMAWLTPELARRFGIAIDQGE